MRFAVQPERQEGHLHPVHDHASRRLQPDVSTADNHTLRAATGHASGFHAGDRNKDHSGSMDSFCSIEQVARQEEVPQHIGTWKCWFSRQAGKRPPTRSHPQAAPRQAGRDINQLTLPPFSLAGPIAATMASASTTLRR